MASRASSEQPVFALTAIWLEGRIPWSVRSETSKAAGEVRASAATVLQAEPSFAAAEPLGSNRMWLTAASLATPVYVEGDRCRGAFPE